MQTVDRVREIRRETPAPQQEPPTGAALEIHLTWSLIQIILCVLALAALVAVKELLPAQYDTLVKEYKTLMAGELFTQESDLIIIGEE